MFQLLVLALFVAVALADPGHRYRSVYRYGYPSYARHGYHFNATLWLQIQEIQPMLSWFMAWLVSQHGGGVIALALDKASDPILADSYGFGHCH